MSDYSYPENLFVGSLHFCFDDLQVLLKKVCPKPRKPGADLEAYTPLFDIIRDRKDFAFQNDQDFYQHIRRWFEDQIQFFQLSNEEVQGFRAKVRIAQVGRILRELKIDPIGKTYLDFGAGDGIIARQLSKSLNFKQPIFLTDIKETWHAKYHQESKAEDSEFRFLNENGKIPFHSTFDIVSCMMVLHHIKAESLKDVLFDLKSHMHAESILVVREHNVEQRSVPHALCHIEHALHSLVHDKQTMDEFQAEYYGNYLSESAWLELFAEAGFQCIYSDGRFPMGPTKYFYAVYQIIKQ